MHEKPCGSHLDWTSPTGPTVCAVCARLICLRNGKADSPILDKTRAPSPDIAFAEGSCTPSVRPRTLLQHAFQQYVEYRGLHQCMSARCDPQSAAWTLNCEALRDEVLRRCGSSCVAGFRRSAATDSSAAVVFPWLARRAAMRHVLLAGAGPLPAPVRWGQQGDGLSHRSALTRCRLNFQVFYCIMFSSGI